VRVNQQMDNQVDMCVCVCVRKIKKKAEYTINSEVKLLGARWP